MAKRDEPAKTKSSDREAKLVQALRANLRRRKGGPGSKSAGKAPSKPDKGT